MLLINCIDSDVANLVINFRSAYDTKKEKKEKKYPLIAFYFSFVSFFMVRPWMTWNI